MHAFVAYVGLLSVLRYSQLDIKTPYFVDRRSGVVVWEDGATVGWFSYIGLLRGVLGIPARETKTGNKIADDV